MNKRSGFTLMELLLVVAILAIIAAVAAPQFFRTATQSVDEARRALLKANYQAIKAAINMQLWDQTNNPGKIPLSNFAGAAFAGSLNRTNLLITNGYLQESCMSYENQDGAKRRMLVGLFNQTGATTVAAPTGAASAPYFMDAVALYEVATWNETQARITFTTPAGSFNNIDAALRAGSTWDQIWEGIKTQ